MPSNHFSKPLSTTLNGPERTDARRANVARTRSMALVFGLIAVLGLLGCGESGGGSGAPPGAAAVIAVDPVNLAQGQTVAQLAWPPSEGPIEHYVVFESRNGSGYTFSQITVVASADVTGVPGDTLQITVIAVGTNGELSESSPPSPPLIFHPPETSIAAVMAQSAPGGGAPMVVATAEEETPSNADPTEIAEETTEPAPETADAEASDEETSSLLATTLRALLLGADTRLPESGLSSEASQWLQSQVDREIAAGVSLAGTGHQDDDALRDLVWQDHAGQLFVSDGQNFLDADDLPSTFAEALRLNATERFVGLADFDGDGQGDWLIEDTATGEVWVIDGVTDQSTASDQLDPETRLAGHGDFDGDGQAELLWIGVDNGLQLERPGGVAPSLDPMASSPDGFEFLAIADLDGNGHDDLLGRAADGTLLMALVVETVDSAELVLTWQAGPADTTEGLDLVATLDLDDDGAAEIVWLNGDDLEIWDAESGLETILAF